MGRIMVGIGGWTYEPWRGTFYPQGLRQKDELAFAASRLTTIEINGTYYRSQSRKSFAEWAAAVPENFVYAVKASRYCTNRKQLGDAGDSIAKFVGQGIAELGEKLGPILWQLAPTKVFGRDEIAAFLRLLPSDVEGVPLRHAIEARHDSFRDPAFAALAASAGVAIVRADHESYPLIEADTAGFSYLRLMRSVEEEQDGYAPAALDRYAVQMQRLAKAGDVFVYFISGAKVRAPAAAQALLARLG